MSNNNGDNSDPEPPRDDKGRFKPESKTVDQGQILPSEGDYSKMNTILQKQTGMSAEKFVEYQRKFGPRELFEKLNFLADNVEVSKKQGLPPNEFFTPISPDLNKIKLPGKSIGKQRMGKESKFGLHLAFDPRELLTPKKKE